MQEVDRTRRVSELLRRELATLISRELSDPNLRGVSVSAVRVSRDLKNATVFFSSLDPGHGKGVAETRENPARGADGGPGQTSDQKPVTTAELEKRLNKVSGFLRHHLSKSADLRVTPSLRFKYDDSIKRGVEMSSLIDRLNKGNHGED